MNNKKLTREKNRRRGLVVSAEIAAKSCRNMELWGLIPSPLESLSNFLSWNDFECIGAEFWTFLNSQEDLELNLSSCPSLQSRKRKFAVSYPIAGTGAATLSLCQKRSTGSSRLVFDPF